MVFRRGIGCGKRARRALLPPALGLAWLVAPAEASSQSAAPAAGDDDMRTVQSAVTPPSLIEFVKAPYPAEAQAKGVEADVVLALDIDETGKVTAVEVVEPAGYGFDEAARAAALAFVFSPATRAGKPVKSRILYRYSFHFEAPPPAAAAAAAPVSELVGSVLLVEGKTPIAGAEVKLSRDGAVVATQRTGENGAFAFQGLAPGVYTVSITAAGFEPVSAEEHLGADESVRAVYRVLALEDADALTVTVQGARATREVTRRSMTRRELARVPGTSGDALRALQNLPGVSRPPSLSGVLIVRGNEDQTTPVLIDGMWVPNVYHFGGLSSIFPTELLDEINFYPGNFSVRYGRAIAGMVDAHFRETRADGRYHGMAQLDLIDARIMAEGPLPGIDGVNFMGGFRRSHVDAWLIPLIENEDTQIVGAPVYYDYQFLVDTRPSPKSYLRIGLLGSDDRFRILASASAAGGELNTSNATWGFGSVYRYAISPVLDFEHTLTVARSRQIFELSTIGVDSLAYGGLQRAEFTYRMWPNATLRTGSDVLVAPYDISGQLPEDPGAGAPDTGSFVVNPPRRFDEKGTFFQPAVYAEMDMAPSRRASVVTGVRLDYDLDTRSLDVSPRMSGRYDLVADFPKTTLKAGTGVFHQPPLLPQVVMAENPAELRSRRSFQNSLGVEQDITEQLDLSVESFYNLLDDLVSRAPDEHGVLRDDNLGTGRIFGAEVLLRYSNDERLFGWISYTLSRSERKPLPSLPLQLFALDQTHILTLLGSYVLGSGWEIGARFRYVTGNLYTPCTGAVFSSLSNEYLCVPGPTNSRRLPPFHQLDVRVDKTWDFSSFRLGVYLDLINAYNRTNPDSLSYNFDYSRSRVQSQSLPIVPSLGVRGEF
jgi:TonB family protein